MGNIEINSKIYNSAVNYFVNRNKALIDQELTLIKDFGPEEAVCFMYKDLFILVMYEPIIYHGMNISGMTLTIHDNLVDLYYKIFESYKEPLDFYE